ncbi:type 1 glutamine amidotransferase [Desulfopila inferna]|uniref:type 1 glutamine amidotransferase n=1 Tax=Desulfopila inferna TaxID=468528 RepID=UPI001966A499|nr:type 1 glutamine amidotransferase [Desulfopila inferna]MBM9604517.1 type 1 glutamine amidotransferase [Desulfopila inferna]
MNVHYIQHVPFEGLGSIENWVQNNAHTLTRTRPYLAENFPSGDDIDLLIIMGGPMNIYEERKYPWLTAEKRFIDRAIHKGRPVVGICLGAQLLADILGARVYANENTEIGWHPVMTTDLAMTTQAFKTFPRNIEAFHWHGDTFDLPQGAKHVARSNGCEHQAFVYDERIIGLQFHLETTLASAQQLIANCTDEIVPGHYIQDTETMIDNQQRFKGINNVMNELLDRIL